jgi:IS1 family transposase
MEVLGFKSIIDLLKAFPNEQTCIDHLEILRWNGNIVSPFDENSIVYKCKSNKYRCKATKKYFNVRTNTIFDNTKIPLQKWFMALYIFSSHKKGISSHQLARDISVTQKTAWFLLHRLRYAFEHPAFKEALGINGTVEIDETYVGGKDQNRHKNKKKSTGSGMVDKTSVFGLLEREKKVIAFKVPKTDGSTLKPLIRELVDKSATIVTDGYGAYHNLKKEYSHVIVDHIKGIYAEGIYHTNTLEGFWSLFKRGIIGIYHNISEKHINSYINEFTLRYNTRKSETSQRFDLILCNVVGRLTYKQLIENE